MLLHKNNLYKHGVYEVGDYKTYSKLEAIELQRRMGSDVRWNFNDEAFGSVDWTKEPDVDLWEMYKARARQIRESYDYVVLFFSGGSDSTNILKAWIEADCKIDEVANLWNYDATKNKQDYMNAEINHVAMPIIQNLKDRGYDFKYRLIDISQLCVDWIRHIDLDYNYFVNYHYSPNNPSKSLLREKIPDYVNLINSGKSLCFVWGVEKPNIFYHHSGQYYFQFFDKFDGNISVYTQRKIPEGWYDELFYWTPDMPELIVKQAHTVANFVKTCDLQEFYSPKYSQFGFNTKINQYLTVESTARIIYPKWDPNTFSLGKSQSIVLSDRDQWYWHGNTDGVKDMRSKLRSFFNTLGPYWLSDGINPRNGVRPCTSPKYFLS